MLEGMMIAEAVGDEGWGHGDMPGQLPGEDMVAVNFGDDEAEEGPASAAQAMGGFDVDPLRQDAEDREQETTDEDDDEGIMVSFSFGVYPLLTPQRLSPCPYV